MIRHRAGAAVCFLGAIGCGGTGSLPTMEGREGMLSQTAVAQKCEEAADGHLKPFVVEWDATDLSTFEARASEGTILVQYQGCGLEALYECSGTKRFGSYGTPHFTSGTVQGFDIENQGELYAELPLGAAKLSGRINAGEKLHLEYFVSGVATSSRDAIFRGEADSVGSCKGATHYVWGYNLGAFELASSEEAGGGVEASVYGAGIGAKRSRKEDQVAHGGELGSCKSQEQRACRVPIRLILRPIKDGDHPSGPMPGAVAGGPPPGAGGDPAAAAQEQVAVAEAVTSIQARALDKLLDKRDGKGCLADMEEVFRLDPRMRELYPMKIVYIRCLMRAGRCDEGKKDFRDHLASDDAKRIKTDEMLDKEVSVEANRYCPPSTAKNDADFVIRAAREMGELSHKDGKSCRAKFDEIASRIVKLDRKNRDHSRARADGRRALESGVRCVVKNDGCAAFPLYAKFVRIDRPNATDAAEIAKKDWPGFAKRAGAECP